jgi:hypothetical protein
MDAAGLGLLGSFPALTGNVSIIEAMGDNQFLRSTSSTPELRRTAAVQSLRRKIITPHLP